MNPIIQFTIYQKYSIENTKFQDKMHLIGPRHQIICTLIQKPDNKIKSLKKQRTEMSEQSQWKLMKLVYNILETIQKKAIKITCISNETSFYRKYRNSSLAILNNFSSISEAINIATQYQVPLLHLIVCNTDQEQFISNYLLLCFQNSQILNQGFILWVQFHNMKDGFLQLQLDSCKTEDLPTKEQGTLKFYYNQKVYKQMKIMELPANDEQIYEILNSAKTQYYELADQTRVDEKLLKGNKERVERPNISKEANVNKQQRARIKKAGAMQANIRNLKNRENKREEKMVDDSCSERQNKDGRKSKSLQKSNDFEMEQKLISSPSKKSKSLPKIGIMRSENVVE